MKSDLSPESFPRYPSQPEDENIPVVITGLSLAHLLSLNNHFAAIRNRNFSAGEYLGSFAELAETLRAEAERELKRAGRKWEVDRDPIPADQDTPARRLTASLTRIAQGTETVISLLRPGASPGNLRQVADDLQQLAKILLEVAAIQDGNEQNPTP